MLILIKGVWMKRSFFMLVAIFMTLNLLRADDYTLEESYAAVADTNRSVNGYFVNYGSGAYDWLYITAGNEALFKLEGVDEDDHFAWTAIDTALFDSVDVVPASGTIAFGSSSGTSEAVQAVAGKTKSINGYFVNYGKGAYDWLYMTVGSQNLFKLEGIDRSTNELVWSGMNAGYFSSFGADYSAMAFGGYKTDPTNGYDIKTMRLEHPSAYISQMCYTKTLDDQGKAHNPCFSCHNQNKTPNYVMGDAELQAAYDFPEPALENPFLNHFKDFTPIIEKISDQEIIEYINTDNYLNENNEIILAKKLSDVPSEWDYDNDGEWTGYLPDCYFNFDEHGMDRDPNGNYTRWAAFGYYPFLGTFWPTNGSTDDVLIRLDGPFAQLNEDGDFNLTVYRVNLAIVEAMIKEKNVAIDPVDEKALGVDLDKNGDLGVASEIVYEWAPLEKKYMHYAGYAKTLQEAGTVHLARGLYPENTEFLHSVRYIQCAEDCDVGIVKRMKELRYAKKLYWLTYATLQNKGLADLQEKSLDPDLLEVFKGNMESGLGNTLGWIYQGFIEDKYGDLRPQSYEETVNCMGCHSGLSVTVDSTFVFPRKLDSATAFQRGWYHWTQKGIEGLAEPKLADGTYEYTNYLQQNDYGDEFRANDEVKAKFFLADGTLDSEAVAQLHEDISYLLIPSRARAMKLNKGYKALVETQRFFDGKAAHAEPFANVHDAVESGESTGNDIYLLPE